MNKRDRQVNKNTYIGLLYIKDFICSIKIIIMKENKALIDKGKEILSIIVVINILVEDFVK